MPQKNSHLQVLNSVSIKIHPIRPESSKDLCLDLRLFDAWKKQKNTLPKWWLNGDLRWQKK